VEAAFGITSEQFLAWNPSINANCTLGFDAGDAYCVGINPNATSTTTTSPPTTSQTNTASANGTYSILPNTASAVLSPIPTATGWPPTPTQSGILANCEAAWNSIIAFEFKHLLTLCPGLRYYQANLGDTCQSIVNRYANLITLDDL
jgi:hypothetical protein